MERVTQSNVEGAFKRLHRAMEWPELSPWKQKLGENGARQAIANVGAVYLSETGYGFQIEVVVNEGGGVTTPFMGWGSKREAFDTMAAMASAVEEFKRKAT